MMATGDTSLVDRIWNWTAGLLGAPDALICAPKSPDEPNLKRKPGDDLSLPGAQIFLPPCAPCRSRPSWRPGRTTRPAPRHAPAALVARADEVVEYRDAVCCGA